MNNKALAPKTRFNIETGLTAIIFAVFLIAGCQSKSTDGQVPESSSAVQPAAASVRSGTVTETMNSGGYTYLEVEDGSETFWVAAPEFSVMVGDKVIVPEGMAMPDYYSRTLDKTFDLVYFVPRVQVGDAPPTASIPTMPPGHPSVQKAEEPAEVIDVAKADGGYAISDIYAKQTDLENSTISVRGIVVKYNDQIMGTNWLHIQDGTGEDGTNDLTVTTQQTVKVGDTVLVSGKLVTDKDFGSGYRYEVIIENATVTVE